MKHYEKLAKEDASRFFEDDKSQRDLVEIAFCAGYRAAVAELKSKEMRSLLDQFELNKYILPWLEREEDKA